MESAAEFEIDVHCSPRSYQNLQNNPSYLEEVRQYILRNDPNVAAIDPDTSNEVSLVVEDNVVDQDVEKRKTEKTNVGKQVWLDAPIKLLLALVKEVQPKVGKSIKFKNKKKMWIHIHGCFLEKGYEFSLIQIENKYRSLERQFKHAINHNSKTGRNRITIKHERELRDLLEERPAIFPEHVMGGKGTGDGLSKKQLMARAASPQASTSRDSMEQLEANSSMQQQTASSSEPQRASSPEPSTSRYFVEHGSSARESPAEYNAPSRRNQNYKADILEELRLMRKEKGEYHREALKLYAERTRTMEEQRREKTEVLKELRDMLKK